MDGNRSIVFNFPRMTVGVMGSAGGDLATQVCQPVRRLGAAIDTHSAAIITSPHGTSSVTHLSERDHSNGGGSGWLFVRPGTR
jgi:putative lipoic acid-binding regulatory protein